MVNNSSCYYNCSQPPDSLSPYPDISGVGVLTGYTATAGMVVLILVFHYHIAHDPTLDPFRKGNFSCASASSKPRPNPIDVVYLRSWTTVLARLMSKTSLPKIPKAKTHPRLEAAFIKCVQSMSDLQILTGISILISGYVQLRCGLSAFHWQIIVSLAWFSSITHLSCLTFLRNYLYNRPAERMCRLVAMGLMLVMLLVAMMLTGGYNWTDVNGRVDGFLTPAPGDYAICYFQPNPNVNDGALTFATMIISVVLLALGFVLRVIRLHKSLSISVVGRARTVCSEKARDRLRQIYTRMNLETSDITSKRLFVYRPLLALLLTARALLDLWNSMFIEILWMVGSFALGLVRLLQTLRIEDGGSSDWSFGQVIPIVLLAAPLFVIFEPFAQGEQSTNTLSAAVMQIHTAYSQSDHDNASSDMSLQERDHPDRDFYLTSNWTQLLIFLMVAYATGTAINFLVLNYWFRKYEVG